MQSFKNKKHYLSILIFTSISFIKIYSQESTITSGGNATGIGGSFSYSIGQVAYAIQTGANGIVEQGVQQPFEISTLGNDDFIEIGLVMSAYPNPTTNVLHLMVGDNKWDDLSFQFFDIRGKKVSKDQKILVSETMVSMQELPQGIYFLAVNSDGKTIKTFKIIKK